MGSELLACVLDEAQVEFRADDRIAQLLERDSSELIVEGQRVHEDRARDIGSVGRHATVVLPVNRLGECRLIDTSRRNIVRDRRQVCRLPESCDDLTLNSFKARIDMMHMYCSCVVGLLLPQVCNGTRQQPQHAAHSLKVAERRCLSGKRLDHFGMQRVACAESLYGARVRGVLVQRLSAGHPALSIGLQDWVDLRLVDGFEQTPAQHLDGFVFLGWVQQCRFTRRDFLGFVHLVGDEVVLIDVRI